MKTRFLALAATTIVAATLVTAAPASMAAPPSHVPLNGQRTTLNVGPQTSGLTLSADKDQYAYDGVARITAHLDGGVENRTVSIYAQENLGEKHLVRTGEVNSAGNLFVRAHLRLRTTFSAVYAGDSSTPAATARVFVNVAAKVSNRLLHYYKTVGNYRLYHTDQDPVLVATVAPPKGRHCLYFLAQKWLGGTWQSYQESRCFDIDVHSQVHVVWGGEHTADERIRIRGQYHGDAANLSTVGNWSYLRFTQ